MQAHRLQYRPEIDGLRALAIVPVVLFHSGWQLFSGGYIGVDVFFVISGYLITSLLIKDMSEGNFSLVRFYERRARRLLPALMTVLLVTTTAAYLLMNPEDLAFYSRTLVSVATFSSNVLFFFNSGYFAASSQLSPLLHTWSLAIEEQYYLVFPLLFMLMWKHARGWIVHLLIAATLVSLLLSTYLVERYFAANFYLISSRAWELGIGSLLALAPKNPWEDRPQRSGLLGAAGLLMILWSICSLDKHSGLPGLPTLIPVMGAALVIYFANPSTWVGRLLAIRPLVATGLISYSVYLWHQPVFAFMALKSVGRPSPAWFLAAIALIVLMSFLSWKYIETPCRKSRSRTWAIRYAALSMGVVAVGLLGILFNGFEARFPANAYETSIEHSPKRRQCHASGEKFRPPEDACKFFATPVTWASLGDSHTVELAYTLARRLEPQGQGLVQLSFSGCPPALLFEARRAGCSKWLRQSVDYLKNNKAITDVVMGFRHSAYLFGDHLDSYPEVPDGDPRVVFKRGTSQVSRDGSKELYWKSFEAVVNELMAAGKTVHVVYPFPELPMDIDRAIYPASVLSTDLVLDLEKSTTTDYYRARNRFMLARLDGLPYGPRLRAVKPLDILCSPSHCPAVKDGRSLYFDDNHLSLSGADLVAERILRP